MPLKPDELTGDFVASKNDRLCPLPKRFTEIRTTLVYWIKSHLTREAFSDGVKNSPSGSRPSHHPDLEVYAEQERANL